MVTKEEVIQAKYSKFANLEATIDNKLKAGIFNSYSFYADDEKNYFVSVLKHKYESGGWKVKIDYINGDNFDQREPSYWKVTFN